MADLSAVTTAPVSNGPARPVCGRYRPGWHPAPLTGRRYTPSSCQYDQSPALYRPSTPRPRHASRRHEARDDAMPGVEPINLRQTWRGRRGGDKLDAPRGGHRAAFVATSVDAVIPILFVVQLGGVGAALTWFVEGIPSVFGPLLTGTFFA